MVGIILAAGDGTRLKSSTHTECCKPLIKLNNKTLLEYSLDNLVQLQITTAFVVVGKEGTYIESAFGDEYKGIDLHYVYQQEQKGLMNAFFQALIVMDNDETVLLQLSDEIFIDMNFQTINNILKTEEFDFYCGVTPEESPEKIMNNFSVETDNNFLLTKCVEKPKAVTNDIKGTGFTIFNGRILKIIKEYDELRDLCDCFNFLTKSGYKGLTFFCAKKEFNINTADDLDEAESYLK